MKISGFSYVRNGFKYEYPFMQSIQSVLPICDEFVIAVGDSEDGTREAIEGIGSSKIKIVDTVWNEQLRTSGKIFAQQANIALKETTGDWAFHIQADEVIHEQDLNKIHEHIIAADSDKRIEGLLFNFLNFYGSYKYLNNSRYQHSKEIRIFRNKMNIFSYRDSQGFRKYPSFEDYLNDHKGFKLNVRSTNIPVYHYSYVRKPEKMNMKSMYFEKFWHDDKYIEEKYKSTDSYDYYDIDRIKLFEGTHPAIMSKTIEKEDWEFNPGKIKGHMPFKDKLIYWLEDKIKYRIGAYKNYILVR